jgi:hypothetical protein
MSTLVDSALVKPTKRQVILASIYNANECNRVNGKGRALQATIPSRPIHNNTFDTFNRFKKRRIWKQEASANISNFLSPCLL